jgi:pimeloyl-ACP methyl ester carboxylesterase
MDARPYKVNIPQETLDDLRERLDHTRFPDEVEDADWDYGTGPQYMQELVAYWRDGFDWRRQEEQLNQFAQFRAEVDGLGLHFVRERGKEPNPLPLLLTHGWLDSFYRCHKVIPMLTVPASYGGDPADSFDVVAPSVTGYGFSDRPVERGFTSEHTADLFARLMSEGLGYERFGAHGGDVGSGVMEKLAASRAASLVGIHLTDVPYWHLFTVPKDNLSGAEQAYLEAGMNWQMEEGAYALIPSTKPQTPAYALNDSPAGLAAWIVEKFRTWSDCDGDVEKRFTKDELLTNLTIYWATETIYSSFRIYYETQHNPPEGGAGRIGVSTGVAIFLGDIVPVPREFAERFFDLRRWTRMPRGGHFAAMEEPELLVEDLREFFRPLRETA